jgi:hypothetical protein
MPTPKAGLLFVNKTSSSKSLSNSKGDLDGLREIHKHVQKSRDYEKERENRRQLKRARLLPLGWVPISVAPKQAPVAIALPTPPETPAVKDVRPLVTTNLGAVRQQQEDGSLNEADEQQDESPALSVVMPTAGSIEPFGQFQVPMNAEKYRILDYFCRRFFPAVTRSDMVAFMGHPRDSSTNPAIQLVRRAVSDELHVLALLSAASARMQFVEGSHFSRPEVPERLASATLQRLRQYLAMGKPVTHELVQSILYLWAVESYRTNWEAVRTHGAMIMHLADTYLGGFRNLEPYMKRMLWIADRFQAAATQSPPLIRERWETEDLAPQQYASVSIALHALGKQPMGSGLGDISATYADDFRTLLDRVLDLCSVVQCHWIGISQHPMIPDRQWTTARSFFVGDELLTFTGIPSADREGSRLQECMRLALIIWMAFVPASYATASPTLTLRAAVDTSALRNTLAELLDGANGRRVDSNEILFLFWVAALGAVSSEVGEIQEWFAVQFQRLAKQLGIFSWGDFVPVQERFLMLDPLRAGNLTKLAWLLQRAVHADVGS